MSPLARLWLIALLLSFVSGCGWYTNSSVDQVAESNRNGPSNSNRSEDQILDDQGGLPDDTRPPQPGDSSSVSFFVEATSGMQQATVVQHLQNWLFPQSALAIDAGDRVNTADIFVGQLDYRGNIVAQVDTGTYSTSLNPDNSYSVTFQLGLPERLDLVVVAELTNGVRLRHPLPNSNQSFRINAASEYAVRKLFTQFASQAQLDQFVSCSGGDASCTSQRQLRVINSMALSNGLQDFEITLPTALDLEEIMDYLDDQVAVKDYAESYASSILEDKLDTAFGSQITPVMDARDGSYNSIYFSLGLNQGDVDGSADQIVFGNQGSRILVEDGGTRQSYLYPSFVFSPSLLGLQNGLLVETLPFGRQTQTQIADGYTTGPLPGNNDIVKFIGTSISYLSESGFSDLARLQIQAVTDEDSNTPTGWLFNPHFTRLYTTRNSASSENSDSFATAFWSTGNLLALAPSGNNYERLGFDERQNSFGWIFHSQTSPNSAQFSLDTLDDSDYITVSFQQLFGSEPALTWVGSLDYWSVSGETVTRSQPTSIDPENAGGAEVFNTKSLSRASDNVPTGLQSTRFSSATDLALANLPTRVYDQTAQRFNDIYRGRISVSDWGGISDPLGNVLTFNTADGSGIAHAVKVRGSGGSETDGRYFVYGNSVSINGSQTTFHNHNGSTLIFSGGVATLTLKDRVVTANHISGQVGEVVDNSSALSSVDQTNSVSLGAIRNLLTLEFDDPAGNTTPLALNGASASGGNLLIMRIEYGDQIGLLYGFKELQLTETSN